MLKYELYIKFFRNFFNLDLSSFNNNKINDINFMFFLLLKFIKNNFYHLILIKNYKYK